MIYEQKLIVKQHITGSVLMFCCAEVAALSEGIYARITRCLPLP